MRLIVRLLLGIAAIVAILALGSTMGWWEKLGRLAGPWLWWALFLILTAGIVAVIGGSIVALRRFIPRYRERRFLAHLRSDDVQAPQGEEEDLRQLQAKLLEAIRTLEKAPEKKQRGSALYATPWYLLIGASQSGKTAMLRGVANSSPPFARPPVSADAPTQNCDWWFFNTAIILDSAGRYAFPTQGERDSAQWYRLLALLRSYRVLQPINGLIITMAADALVSKRQEELRFEALELRKRIDEAIRELGMDFPVYLVVTRCDMLEGFTEFFGCLPEQMLKQVFGSINEAQPRVDNGEAHAVSMPHFESVSETLVERLKQLRLSILNAEKLPPVMLRQRIFCFPEEFRALQQPLAGFVEMLLAENPVQHLPFFRGLFFSSAQQQGTPLSFLRRQFRFDGQNRPVQKGAKAYFLHDLFAVILPRDQYLVRTTGRANWRRLLRHLFGLGGCLAVCLLVALFLTQAFLGDRRVRAAVDEAPCAAVVERQPVEPLLDQAQRCQQAVQTLGQRNHQRPWPYRFVFNRSGRLEKQLQQQYVEKFATEVLAPLDRRIEQHLTAGSDTIPLVFLLIKRIELINQCLSLVGCPASIDKDMQPDYQVMLNPVQRQPVVPGQVATLQQAYETYLRWAQGAPEVLRQEQEAQTDRLRNWFASKQFAPRQIIGWANRNHAPVTLQTYWEGLPSTGSKDTVQVEGAYTRGAWKQGILPFLQRAGEAVPEMQPLLEAFQEDYRVQYFEQWRRFLADVPRGELPWQGTRERRRQLALRLLEKKSPYNRMPDIVFENLQPFLPEGLVLGTPSAASAEGEPTGKSVVQRVQQLVGKWPEKVGLGDSKEAAMAAAEATLPAWVRVLRRFLGSDSRGAYLDALQQIGEQLASDPTKEKSFRLAQTGFQEERPSEKSTHPVLKALWIISQFRKTAQSGETSEAAVWPLLERPVLLAWKVILEDAGVFLQKSWDENVVAPSRGLSKMEQVYFFYGPQGKLREFVDQFAKPFLVDNESRPGQVLGAEVPLASALLSALREERQLRPSLAAGGDTTHAVRVEASQNSSINSHTNIVEDKTEFLLECGDRPFKASNRPKTTTSVLWSPATCGDVMITVFVSCDRSCVEKATTVGISVSEVLSLPLVKRYTGQTGFLHFIQDFGDGSQEFRSSDFVDDEGTLRRYGINAIRVFYRVSVPFSLEKLISLLSGFTVPPAIVK